MKYLFFFLLSIFSINLFCQTQLSWPLKQSDNFEDSGYYYLSNYVDHDSGSGILDYNGGDRTYDGHDGTDIVIWPYWWQKMNNNQVEVVASASGIIVGKADGHFDQSCAWDGGNSNFLKIEHSDGSTAYYGHLKNGTVTSKLIGETILTNEYIGIVGSSGNSDKPHLHFEIRLANGELIDPFVGPNNPTTSTSWWINQPAYHDSGLNRIVTSTETPEHTSTNCPNLEDTNEKCAFMPGDSIKFTRYYRHSVIGQETFCKVIQPDGSIWDSWTHTHNATAIRRYSWNTRFLPQNAQLGYWTFECIYLGQSYFQYFIVDSNSLNCPCEYVIPKISQDIFHALNRIGSNAILLNSDDVIYKAGKSIQLSKGFNTPTGSQFEALIENCNN